MSTPVAVLENGINTGFAGDQLYQNESVSRINREMPRWVVFVGDLVAPEVQRRRSDIAIGGDVFGTKFRTLYRTKYLLRRCEMSPMLVAKDFVNDESVGENGLSAQREQVPNPLYGQHPRELPLIDHVFYWCYPGEEISSLISSGGSDKDMGIREFEALQGMSEADVVEANFQRLIFNGSEYFPDWNTFLTMKPEHRSPFNRLSMLQRHLDQRAAGETELRDLIEVYQASAEQYGAWGDTFLETETRRVKTPMTAGGYVHSYSTTAIKLFEQLGVSREDYLRRDVSVAHEPTTNAESQSIINQLALQGERQNRIIELLLDEKMKGLEATAVTAPVEVPEMPVTKENVFTDIPTAVDKPTFAMKSEVIVNGQQGTVVMKPGGKYVVQFADESRGTFEAHELTAVETDVIN